jgi:hypothetical protein
MVITKLTTQFGPLGTLGSLGGVALAFLDVVSTGWSSIYMLQKPNPLQKLATLDQSGSMVYHTSHCDRWLKLSSC